MMIMIIMIMDRSQLHVARVTKAATRNFTVFSLFFQFGRKAASEGKRTVRLRFSGARLHMRNRGMKPILQKQ